MLSKATKNGIPLVSLIRTPLIRKTVTGSPTRRSATRVHPRPERLWKMCQQNRLRRMEMNGKVIIFRQIGLTLSDSCALVESSAQRDCSESDAGTALSDASRPGRGAQVNVFSFRAM